MTSIIENRFNELYRKAYEKGYNAFTNFLNLEEQSILINTYLPCTKFGGYNTAERIIAGFGESIIEEDFPISILLIEPVSQKFADSLSHRDFLGGLMNLGIKRELLGDIIVNENRAYLFCLNQIKDYITDNLRQIKHTTVKVSEISALPAEAVTACDESELIVSSLRVDAVISAIFKLSRNDSSKLFKQGKIFVNSKATENTSYQLNENDIVSVRGFGRFQFIKTQRTTKKDRLVISIKIYK